MGVMQNILQQQTNNKSNGGYRFTVYTPTAGIKPSLATTLATPINITSFNNDVSAWGKNVAGQLRVATSGFARGKTSPHTYKQGIHKGKHEKKLSSSIRVKFRKEKGGEQIETIGFGLERHGVFRQKGVGRGYVANGAGVSRTAKSDAIKSYRTKTDWFNSTLDKNIKSLTDIITKHTGDAIIANTKKMFIQ